MIIASHEEGYYFTLAFRHPAPFRLEHQIFKPILEAEGDGFTLPKAPNLHRIHYLLDALEGSGRLGSGVPVYGVDLDQPVAADGSIGV